MPYMSQTDLEHLASAMRQQLRKATMTQEQIALYRAAETADEAWSAELQRLFGKRAGDVRYTSQGKGEPGSELRKRHDAFAAATDAWHNR